MEILDQPGYGPALFVSTEEQRAVFREKEMVQVADWINQAISHHNDDKYLAKLHREIKAFALKYPLPS